MTLHTYLEEIVAWLQTKVKAANAKGLILGVSGGIDSAVVANLAKKACGENVLALILPCETQTEDIADGKLVCERAQIAYKIIELDATFAALKQEFNRTTILQKGDTATHLALANTKARLRMTTLYALGQALGYLVVGTDNWDEWHTGYFTKYGDGGVDLASIIHLTKGEVVAAAHLLNVPQKIIDRKPSAGLVQDVYDEDELQVSYPVIDAYLLGQTVDDKSRKRIEELHKKSAHKRALMPMPKPFNRK